MFKYLLPEVIEPSTFFLNTGSFTLLSILVSACSIILGKSETKVASVFSK